MLFSHDTEASIACLVDLINSAPGAGHGELLIDLDDLADLARRHDVSDAGSLVAKDLSDARDLRPRLRAVFECTSDSEAAALINEIIAVAPVRPRLTDHDGHDWHIHYYAPGARLHEHLAVDGGIALARVITSGERERLRVCEAPDCDDVLVDLSRNRSRRYCDARTCGNRLHVAAYRRRQRSGQDA